MHINVALYLQAVIDGLLLGGLYLVVSVGLSLIFGVLNVVNLAHGAFVAVGAYIAFGLQDKFSLSPYICIPIAFIALFATGWGTEVFLIRRIRTNLVMAIVMLFGVAILLENLLETIFTDTPHGVSSGLPSKPLEFSGVVIPPTYLVTFVVGAVITGALAAFLRFTPAGRAIRAVRMDRGAAEMVGINVNRVFAAAFGLGAGLAGVGGVLLITQTPATPDVTFSVLLPAFVVVTLGGFGSLIGVIVGAMLFGVIQSVSTVAFGIGWSPIAALVALVIVLLIRPAGLLGSRFYVA